MSYERIRTLLANGEAVILDGAMGTEIQARGSDLIRVGWGGPATTQEPDLVRGIHADYIQAGADVISTNTFRGTRVRLRTEGLESQIEPLNRRSVALAIAARAQAGAEGQVAVAGAISTAGSHEVGSAEEGYEAYAEQATILADAGVDLILLEMLKDIPQATAALAAAAATGLPVWAGFSCRVDEAGTVRVLDGEPVPTFDEALTALGALHVDAALIMHTTVEDVGPALDVLSRHWHGPKGAYPHVGKWQRPDWQFDTTVDPTLIINASANWRAQGAQVFGTCCGLGPAYTSALNAAMR